MIFFRTNKRDMSVNFCNRDRLSDRNITLSCCSEGATLRLSYLVKLTWVAEEHNFVALWQLIG